jgi:outer membrane protein assembly factor BamB
MSYEKKDEEYKIHSDDKKDYSFIEQPVDSMRQKQNELPTFQQIYYDLPTSGSIMSFCDFHDGILYFSALDTHVYAVDADTGTMLWKFKTGSLVTSTPLFHKGHIYFGSTDKNFYCLNTKGELIWRKYVGDIVVSSPIAVGDLIFIGNGKGFVFCFSSKGEELWRFKTGDGFYAVPSAVNGMVFVGSYDKNLYALNLEGKLEWKYTAGERIACPLIFSEGKRLFSSNNRSWEKMPQASNPILYAPSYDNNVYAFSTEGEILWKTNCGTSVAGSAGGNNGTIYVGTINGTVYALDSFSGNEKWKFRTGGLVSDGAETSDGLVYFTSFDQRLYCLRENGEKLWDFLTGGPIIARPLIIGDRLYFGSGDTLFYCLNAKNRAVEWTFQVGFGLSESLKPKLEQVTNALVEYDRKVFRVWKPETKTSSTSPAMLSGYGIPKGFAFGGEHLYSFSSPYKSNNSYKNKRDIYKK